MKDPTGDQGYAAFLKESTPNTDQSPQVLCRKVALQVAPYTKRGAIRDQIEQLEEEITKLKAKHHALGGRMNGIHNPFIHKFPPEISSHIFRLCLSTLNFEDVHLWTKAATFTRVLGLRVSELASLGMDNTRPLGYPIFND